MGTNLPAVIETAAKHQGLILQDVNLIMPTETFGAVLGQFDKITLETVRIDTSDAREVYEPGGKGKGFALGKIPLQAIASAISIQWDPRYTGIVESTTRKSRAKAVGILRKPNGETITQTEEKTIDLDVDEDDLRDKAESDASKGNPDGKVVEWGETKTGKKYPLKFTPWINTGEKEAWISRKVKEGIKQRRRFKDELAMTGAKDRVIRAFLALKSTYTAEELSKPLAFPRVTTDTSKMLDDPRVRSAAIGMIGQTTSALYGQDVSKQADIEVGPEDPVKTVIPEYPPMRPADDQQTSPSDLADEALDDSDGFDEDLITSVSGRGMIEASLEEWVNSDKLNAKARCTIEKLLSNPDTPLETLRTYLDKISAGDGRKA
jgi:hypothetical protein